MTLERNFLEIRPLQPDMWALHKRVRLDALAEAPYAFTTQWSDIVSRTDADWMELTSRRASDPNGVTYFAFWDDEPCAMAACVLTELGAEMLAVWVAPDKRKSGIGRALVEYARVWAIDHGADALVVGVYADNTEAVHFYERAGFQLTGAQHMASQATHRSILTMVMDL